jgi:hypothetical protein
MQVFSQFSLTSAAETVIATAKPNRVANRIIFFIVLFSGVGAVFGAASRPFVRTFGQPPKTLYPWIGQYLPFFAESEQAMSGGP